MKVIAGGEGGVRGWGCGWLAGGRGWILLPGQGVLPGIIPATRPSLNFPLGRERRGAGAHGAQGAAQRLGQGAVARPLGP
jgi:hypothetical protein